MWWDSEHVSVSAITIVEEKPNPGFCRKKIPAVVLFKKHHFGVQPVMDAEEFCGEFREDVIQKT